MPLAPYLLPMPTLVSQPPAPRSKSGVVFIGLNIVRLISMIALLLCFFSSIVHLVDDFKAVNAWIKAGSPSSGMIDSNDDFDCELIEYSSIPNQLGGPFFSILSRLLILAVSIMLFASEVGGPAIVRKGFELFFPPLGPAHGLAVLGVLQCFIATTILSHFCPLFSQASAWSLFIVGCANLVLGFFGAKIKEIRQIFSFESLSTLTPQTSVAYGAYKAGSSLASSFNPSATAPSYHSFPTSDEKKDLQPSSFPDEHGRRVKVGPFAFGGQGKKKPSEKEDHGFESAWGTYGKKGEREAKLKGFTISKPSLVADKL